MNTAHIAVAVSKLHCKSESLEEFFKNQDKVQKMTTSPNL